MSRTDSHPTLLERLLRAVNAHDLEGLVSCFAADYVNETPVHPQRGFRGVDQVRRNWAQILTLTDLHAEVPRYSLDGDRLWTEWEMSGTRPDGAPFRMRGVVIFTIDETIRSARFYLEPAEDTGDDIDAHTRRLTTAQGDHAAGGQR